MIAWGAEGIEYKQEGLKKVPRGEDTITNQRDDNVDTKTEQSWLMKLSVNTYLHNKCKHLVLGPIVQ